jgi:hypothetical protein
MVEAQEYQFDDIVPGEEFIIEVLDDKQEPVKQASFTVAVDGGEPQAATSDDSGIVKVTAPASTAEIKLAFG